VVLLLKHLPPPTNYFGQPELNFVTHFLQCFGLLFGEHCLLLLAHGEVVQEFWFYEQLSVFRVQLFVLLGLLNSLDEFLIVEFHILVGVALGELFGFEHAFVSVEGGFAEEGGGLVQFSKPFLDLGKRDGWLLVVFQFQVLPRFIIEFSDLLQAF
jgi:hypothetical protein